VRHRVFIETSVLVSASVYAASEKTPVKLKHLFFDECSDLFGLIRKHKLKRLGISTMVVQDEANGVLEKAIIRQLESEKYPREKWFEVMSVLLSSCGDRMRELSGLLQWEPVDEKDAEDIYKRVLATYLDLRKEASLADPARVASLKTKLAPGPLRKIASSIYKNQEVLENLQLLSLLRGFPSEKDLRILADAIHLLRHYKGVGEPTQMFLASCDTLLSPKRLRNGGYSNKVTKRIQHDYDLECAWPHQICLSLTGL
jgi:hypothetical protein